MLEINVKENVEFDRVNYNTVIKEWVRWLVESNQARLTKLKGRNLFNNWIGESLLGDSKYRLESQNDNMKMFIDT